MVQANVKKCLWAEPVDTAAYIRNKYATRILNDRTPDEIWYGRKLAVNYFRVVGCIAIVPD